MNNESYPIISPKKLIEVALPLDAINAAAAREKSIRHGHPSTLHLWWARRPLAAARAVIFSQLVNDPEDLWRCQNSGVEPNKQAKGHWTKARARLFKIIEELVLWENTTNEEVLERAREEIRKSWRDVCELNKDHPQAAELFDTERMPGLHDPFAGGGTIPLEAQRLGLEAYASDLNPVAVLINKAMIEIPPKFAGMPPINPQSRNKYPLGTKQWFGAEGLAEDVRFYGKWMRDEAEKRIGHLYPKVEITEEMTKKRPDLEPYVGQKLTVIAWLWARTVKSPNPAFSNVSVPLVSTFVLAQKPGKEIFVEPMILDGNYRFTVSTGVPSDDVSKGTKVSRGSFECVMSRTAIPYSYVNEEANAGRMSTRLMACVAKGKGERVYLAPTQEMEQIAQTANPDWRPETPCRGTFASNAIGRRYGFNVFGDYFTDRQLVTLSTYAALVGEVLDVISNDIKHAASSISGDLQSDENYSAAIAVYLAFALDKSIDYLSSLCPWLNQAKNEIVGKTYGRQALPMMWDFAEANPFSGAGGDFVPQLEYVLKCLIQNAVRTSRPGVAVQAAAQSQEISQGKIISTDPPYYDNVTYADLSDFFYVWLRRSLKNVYPQLLSTIATPKSEELIAALHMHEDAEASEEFFLTGMTDAMRQLVRYAHPEMPMTIYYAFKQTESSSKSNDIVSTGWETFLEAMNRAGLQLTGTWPMRTERIAAFKSKVNALASSIVMVCRARPKHTHTVSRREFIRELNATLPSALDAMTRESEGLPSPVAPVDLSQAIIGPGMAIFSKYSAVLEADGTPMTVRTALQLINRFLAEDDFDADTQFCMHWFEQYGWQTGRFGEADVLARSKGTSVDGLKQGGVLSAAAGNVRLLKWVEYPSEWGPKSDQRLPIWEVLHQLIRVFKSQGETGAAVVFAAVQSKAEAARQLAYRLYTLCERKNWAEDARAYNEVVTSWSGIEAAAAKEPVATQRTLFDK
jgi:putative DNA methylase